MFFFFLSLSSLVAATAVECVVAFNTSNSIQFVCIYERNRSSVRLRTRERVSEWVSGRCFIWPFAIYVKISTRYRNAIAWRSVQLKMENSDKIRARYKSKPLNLCWDYADVHVDALCIGFGQLKKKKRRKTTRTKPTTTVTMNSVLHASVFSTISPPRCSY